MGLLDTLGTIASNTPAGIITSAVSTVLDRILPQDPAVKQAAAIEIMKLQAEGTFEQKAQLQTQVAQLAVDQAEASQPGLHFREGAGWVCVADLALLVAKPLIEWGAALAGHPIKLPEVDHEVTSTMLYALLGLGSMHAVQTAVISAKGTK